MSETRDEKTLHVSPDGIRRLLQGQRTARKRDTAPLSANTETHPLLILIIRGIVERLVMDDNFSLVLGRDDYFGGDQQPDFDLTPFGAVERGVSRRHARLHLQNQTLYVTDLGSTNGTFMGDTQLPPGVPTPFDKGKKLMLARLPLRVLYR